MRKLVIPLLLCLAIGSAQAQPVTNPAPVGAAGAYNSAAPTCTAGQFCFLQTDVNGVLKTTGSGSGGASTVSPSGKTTTTANSTIASTGVFQAALAASATRTGCTLQNTGSHVQYVYFGTIGSATTSNAFQVNAGQTISCTAGVIVLTDAVNITGTTGDGYIVASQ